MSQIRGSFLVQLWQAPTHDLCAEYWRAWDRFNSTNGTLKHDRRRRSSDWGEAPEAGEKASLTAGNLLG
jgi:hypothetical protein